MSENKEARSVVGYLFIGGTILFMVYAQLIIKQQINALGDPPSGGALAAYIIGAVLTHPLILSGLLAAVFSALCWMAALTRFDLSYAYPFVALQFVLVSGLSVLVFDEAFTVTKAVGLTTICMGVLVVAIGS